ncbi:MAG TPA: HEAT repeat domain-containing protein [Candidatus Eremiobacteraeota bacterium]|nr:HEAT repeat domain-containing protein [Candidatus Eremiobacteraeota bacterium]
MEPGKEKELNQKGLALLQEGRPEEAILYFNQVIDTGGHNQIKGWFNKGLALKELGKLDESVECFDRALYLENKINHTSTEESLSEQVDLLSEEKETDTVEDFCKQLEGLNEFDPSRVEIIQALGILRSPKSIPSLMKALETNYAAGRDKIAIILAEMEVFEAIPVFNRLLLEDKDPAVRASCALAIGKLAASDSINVLMEALNDPSLEVREEALSALEQFEEENANIGDTVKEFKKRRTLLIRLKDEDDVEKILYEFNDNELAEKILIESLKDNDREDFNIISALAYLGSEKAVEPLIRVLKNKTISSEVRVRAAAFLGNVEDPRVIDPLLKALKDDEVELCISAAEALGKLKERRAVEPLLMALPSSCDKLREKIISSLSRIRHIPPLLKALEDKREVIRISIIEALGKIKNEETLKAVKKLLKNEDRILRNSAVKILLKQEAFEELINLLKDPQIKQKAAELMITSNSDTLRELLIKSLKNSNDSIRKASAEILGSMNVKKATTEIISLLSDPSGAVQNAALEALGKLEAIPSLIKYIEETPSFNEKSLEILAIYGGEGGREILLKYLSHDNPCVRSRAVMGLGRIKNHDDTLKIIEMLQDKDVRVRSSACWSSGKLHISDVIEPLCRSLKDKEQSVRDAAKISLQELALEVELRDIVIGNLTKLTSFSITALFSKEEKEFQKEGKELLKTIQALDT